jgi:hypothetical protein
LLKAAPLGAQEPGIPVVTISPHYQMVMSGNTVDVGIAWCIPEGGGGFMTQYAYVAGGGTSVDVTSQFTVDTWAYYPPPSCQGPNDLWEHWSGTITLLGAGNNELHVMGITWANYAGGDVATYARPTPYRNVVVVADAQSVEARPSSSGNVQRFTVVNTGESQETFSLSRTCTGTASCGTPSPAQLSLSGGQSGTTTVTYSVGGTVGDTGVVRLVASNAEDPNSKGSSWSEVTVTNANAAGVVLVGGGDASNAISV